MSLSNMKSIRIKVIVSLIYIITFISLRTIRYKVWDFDLNFIPFLDIRNSNEIVSVEEYDHLMPWIYEYHDDLLAKEEISPIREALRQPLPTNQDNGWLEKSKSNKQCHYQNTRRKRDSKYSRKSKANAKGRIPINSNIYLFDQQIFIKFSIRFIQILRIFLLFIFKLNLRLKQNKAYFQIFEWFGI